MAKTTPKLREYLAKRDFSRTTEPRPGAVNKNPRLTYLIHRHVARRLHFDLRLEWDGVLKSWAVPKGPALNPQIKRLAVQTEDHPYSYRLFEGIIPAGEYGAGSVTIWDSGSWQPIGNADEGLRKGHLAFELNGDKLHGRWSLIRTGKQQTKDQWLLIKGRDAFAHVGEMDETEKFPAVFVKPQLPLLVENIPTGNDWLHEMKIDGYRLIVKTSPEKCTLWTRNELDWSHKFPRLAEELKLLSCHEALLDGEVAVLKKDGTPDFQLLQNALRSHHGQNLRFFAFDLLYLDGACLLEKKLIERKKILKDLLNKSPPMPAVIFAEHIEGQGSKVQQFFCKQELEGVVSKHQDAAYQPGRSSSWVKTKCQMRQEYVVGGYRRSDKTGRKIRSLLLGEYAEGKLIFRGGCGTGMNRGEEEEIYQALRLLRQKKSPFLSGPESDEETVWVKPKLVVEVQHRGITHGGHLRQASFKGIRLDKKAREVEA